jgi:hypothetical protein
MAPRNHLERVAAVVGALAAAVLAAAFTVALPACVMTLPRTASAQAWSAFDPVGPPRQAIRGITIGPIESSQQQGRGYGTPYSEVLLDELVRLGANAVVVTPFARLWSLSSTELDLDFELPYAESRQGVRRLIEQAHARGLRVVIVPHLWVETGGWRGELDPGSDEGWSAYQAAYSRFVLAWADDAQSFGADGLSIGVECKSWSGRFGAYWTDLIQEIRKRFHGSITYSSNWDEVEDVLFWDQLDWIGINAFYPLASASNASYATYEATARDTMRKLAELSALHERPVVLMEIGYTTRTEAAVEPWLWPDDMTDVTVDEHEQARALYALGRAAADERSVLGFFVWRYYANLDDVSQEAVWGFSPHGKLAEPVLSALLKSGFAADEGASPWRNARPIAPLRSPWW